MSGITIDNPTATINDIDIVNGDNNKPLASGSTNWYRCNNSHLCLDKVQYHKEYVHLASQDHKQNRLLL